MPTIGLFTTVTSEASASAGAAELTLDDVVAHNVAARGGAPRLQAIRSLRLTGKAVFGSGDFRLEGQWALTPQLWMIGGIGRGYLETGLRTLHVGNQFESLDLDFPGSSGWAWIATAGTSSEFDLFGPRLSAEVRTSYLMRPNAMPPNDLIQARTSRSALAFEAE